MIQIKTFHKEWEGKRDAAQVASAWLAQNDGKITVKSIMTDFDGTVVITIVYETFDGAKLYERDDDDFSTASLAGP